MKAVWLVFVLATMLNFGGCAMTQPRPAVVAPCPKIHPPPVELMQEPEKSDLLQLYNDAKRIERPSAPSNSGLKE